MKNILIRLQLLASMFILVLASCSDEVEYIQGELLNGSEVYFASDVKQSYTLSKGDAGSFKLTVYRSDSEEKETVAINQTEFSEGADAIFNIPESVEFRAGAKETEFRVRYNKIEEGKSYSVKLTLGEGTPYANSSIVLRLSYPETIKYEWETVSDGNACLIDNMLMPFGLKNLMIIDMTVEKAKGYDIYRFRSPYDNEYFKAVAGTSLFDENFEIPYIILDGETYKEDGWYIPTTKLGFKLESGTGIVYDPDFETFGSVAVNLSIGSSPVEPDSDDYPLGTYNRQKKMFDFGAVFEQIGGADGGYYAFSAGAFCLYLDQSLMSQDYNRDYTWLDRPELTSLYQSSIFAGAVAQEIEQAEEDPTLYRFPSLYADGTNIVFYCDTEKGSVSVPKGQFTGLTTNFGNNVYLEATPGVCKYDKEEEILTLGYTFYLVDAEGNKTAELIQSVETVLWGHATEVDQLVPGSKIEDFVGKWNAYGTRVSDNKADTAVVTITDDLKFKGLSNIDPEKVNYDDSFSATYDQRTGFITITPQDLPTLDAGNGTKFYPTLAFVNSTTGALTMDKNETLIGGFTKTGKLKFVNSASNSSTYNGIVYVSQDGSNVVIIGEGEKARISGLSWEEHEEPQVANYVVPSLANASLSYFPYNFKKAVRERQNPFLNIVPKPVSAIMMEAGRVQTSSELTKNVNLEKINR